MDTDVIPDWWPLTVPVAVLGTVVLALSQCAVADVVVRLAAWMCGRDCEQHSRKREEWLRHLEDMRPSERPAHAASLLWLAVRSIPLQLSLEGRRRNFYSEILTWLVVDFQEPLGAMARSNVKLWRVMLFVSPRMATKLVKRRVSRVLAYGDDDPELRESFDGIAASVDRSVETLQQFWRDAELAALGGVASRLRGMRHQRLHGDTGDERVPPFESDADGNHDECG